MSASGVHNCRVDTYGHLIEARPPDFMPRWVLLDVRPVVRGLPIENGEVRCPECGRHTPAKIVGEP